MPATKTPKAPKPLSAKKLDALVNASYAAVFNCVTVSIWDLGKISALARAAYAVEPTEAAVIAALESAKLVYAVKL